MMVIQDCKKRKKMTSYVMWNHCYLRVREKLFNKCDLLIGFLRSEWDWFSFTHVFGSLNDKKGKAAITLMHRHVTSCEKIFHCALTENGRNCTLDKKCSRYVTMVTRAGSSPISSFDSLNAVAASSASPSSAFPPGYATSPENSNGDNQILNKCIKYYS